MTFSVSDTPTSIAVGQKAPASNTPTAADVGGDLAKLSTDKTPDPAFYQTSVADALAAHKPFILIFATPKFCTSAQCGPTLDRFKPVAAANPDVTFINVEPYKLQFKDGRCNRSSTRATACIATDISNEWGLRSEPWIFAVDRNGIVPGLVPDHDHRCGAGQDPAGHHRRRLTGRRQVASSSRIATLAPFSVRYQTRTGCAVAWCSTRWPGGNSAPFSSAPMANSSDPWSVGPQGEPADLVEALRFDRHDEPTAAVASAGATGSRTVVPESRKAAAPVTATTTSKASRNRLRVRRSTDLRSSGAGQRDPAPAPTVPVPVLPGAWSGVPSAQRGHVAGPGS